MKYPPNYRVMYNHPIYGVSEEPKSTTDSLQKARNIRDLVELQLTRDLDRPIKVFIEQLVFDQESGDLDDVIVVPSEG